MEETPQILAALRPPKICLTFFKKIVQIWAKGGIFCVNQRYKPIWKFTPDAVFIPADLAREIAIAESFRRSRIGELHDRGQPTHPNPMIDTISRLFHNLSGNGRAATSWDIDVTNRDLGVSRGAMRG